MAQINYFDFRKVYYKRKIILATYVYVAMVSKQVEIKKCAFVKHRIFFKIHLKKELCFLMDNQLKYFCIQVRFFKITRNNKPWIK
jgi:hypothetical protein